MHLNGSTIATIAIAILTFVLGFAYGNLFDAKYDFHLKDWQTFVSMIVAILLGLLAYFGVQGTQRINVMIKEQDRSDQLLPGLRQVHELLLGMRGPLKNLRPTSRYQTLLVLDAAVPIGPTESVEDAVRRKLTLADEHLRREVAEIVFKLRQHGIMLKLGKEELDRCQAELANEAAFAASSHQGLVDMVETVNGNYERENARMGKTLESLNNSLGRLRRVSPMRRSGASSSGGSLGDFSRKGD
jgi:hypothetical protein